LTCHMKDFKLFVCLTAHPATVLGCKSSRIGLKFHPFGQKTVFVEKNH